MVPDSSLTLYADRVLQRAGAGMGRKTFPPVAHPGLAEVTHSTHHAHACAELARVLHDAVSRLQHALHFAALSALREPLHTLAEVTKRPVLLLPLASVALHGCIAGELGERDVVPGGPDLLLPQLLLLRLLPLPRLLLRHLAKDFFYCWSVGTFL